MNQVMKLVIHSLDIVLFFLLGTIHLRANYQDAIKKGHAQRDTSKHQLSTACSGGLVAVSILMSGSMLVITNDLYDLNRLGIYYDFIFRSLIWFVISIVIGLFVLWAIPMEAPTNDPRKRMLIIVPYGLQLFSLTIGTFWLIGGVYKHVI